MTTGDMYAARGYVRRYLRAFGITGKAAPKVRRDHRDPDNGSLWCRVPVERGVDPEAMRGWLAQELGRKGYVWDVWLNGTRRYVRFGERRPE